ncbi:hypothetical protein Tco_1208763 [Tanacetum coccineum]
MLLGKILPRWHQFLDQKIRGAHFSLGIVAGERFAIELTPSTFPQRHFAGDMFPQRHVAGEKVGMLLGKASNVVVNDNGMIDGSTHVNFNYAPDAIVSSYLLFMSSSWLSIHRDIWFNSWSTQMLISLANRVVVWIEILS